MAKFPKGRFVKQDGFVDSAELYTEKHAGVVKKFTR